MKNVQLEQNLNEILTTNNVVVQKSTTKNIIHVFVENPKFEDIGSYPYYNRTAECEADFNELTKHLANKNGKA
jgi:hypothetical protein